MCLLCQRVSRAYICCTFPAEPWAFKKRHVLFCNTYIQFSGMSLESKAAGGSQRWPWACVALDTLIHPGQRDDMHHSLYQVVLCQVVCCCCCVCSTFSYLSGVYNVFYIRSESLWTLLTKVTWGWAQSKDTSKTGLAPIFRFDFFAQNRFRVHQGSRLSNTVRRYNICEWWRI